MRLATAWADGQVRAPEEYLELPSPLQQGAPVWADPMWARYVTGTVERSGAAGFEIEAPWPWEPHRAFFSVWGRTGYDPRISDKALIADFEREAGKTAGPLTFQAWSAASRAFSLAALISPGAHWRAPDEEAERLAREGSAKLTSADVAAAVREAIGGAAQAIARLRSENGRYAELEALLHAAQERVASIPPASAKRLPKPAMQHLPPKGVPANLAFPLGLAVSPATHVRAVRLHYREAGEAGDFLTLEAAPAKAWFHIKAARDVIYYFEIVSRDGRGWFYPDPLAGPPYLHLPVRERKADSPVDPSAKTAS
jgi:hypothetical protein